MKSFPKKINVDNDISISDCPSLSYLSDGMKTSGNLKITNCGINILSDILKVKGDVSVNGCKNLHSLGSGHNINGELSLTNNEELYDLGINSKVEGKLKITDCSSFNEKNIPKWVNIPRLRIKYNKRSKRIPVYQLND